MQRVSDLISGLAVAGLGLAIFLRAQTFPSVGGVAVPPSFYPSLIGLALTLLGLILAATTLARKTVLSPAEQIKWFKRPGNVIAVLSVPLSILIYSTLSNKLGFIATSFPVSCGLFLAFRVRVLTSAIVAFCLTLALYFVFVGMLRVPLPYGLVEALLP